MSERSVSKYIHGNVRALRECVDEAGLEVEDEEFHGVVEALESNISWLEENWGSVDEESSLFDYSHKVRKTASELDVSMEEYANAAFDHPPLFSLSPDTVVGNASEISNRLGVDEGVYVDAALKFPPLFTQKSDTVVGNVSEVADSLDIDRSVYVDAALKFPPLFTQKSDTVVGNVSEVADSLDIDRSVYVDTALDRPQLFSLSPDTVVGNVSEVADSLDIDRSVYADAALDQPQLFYQSPDTVVGNVSEVAERLDIDRSVYIDAALYHPSLLTHSPDTVVGNVSEVAERLDIDRSVYIDAALDHRSLFYQNPDTVAEHVDWVYALEREDVISIPSGYDELSVDPEVEYMCKSPFLFSLADNNFELRLYNGLLLDKDPYMKNLTGTKYKSLDELENKFSVLDDMAWDKDWRERLRDHLPNGGDAEIGNYRRSVAYDQEVIGEYLQRLENQTGLSAEVAEETKNLMSTVK